VGSLSILAATTAAGPDPCDNVAMQMGRRHSGLGVYKWEHLARSAGLEDY
jgi:hypothetical protein